MPTDSITTDVSNGKLIPGYYWVKLPKEYNGKEEHWEIAFYNGKIDIEWELCGNDVFFPTEYMLKVGDKVPMFLEV